MKITSQDTWFSKCVRQRAGWACQKCNKSYLDNPQGLDCSHFFGRNRLTIRWHPNNAAAHCRGCHGFLGDNPVIFTEWIESHLGKSDYQSLRLLSNQTVRFTPQDRKDISKHYRDTFRWMETQVGLVEFPCAPIIEQKLMRVAA